MNLVMMPFKHVLWLGDASFTGGDVIVLHGMRQIIRIRKEKVLGHVNELKQAQVSIFSHFGRGLGQSFVQLLPQITQRIFVLLFLRTDREHLRGLDGINVIPTDATYFFLLSDHRQVKPIQKLDKANDATGGAKFDQSSLILVAFVDHFQNIIDFLYRVGYGVFANDFRNITRIWIFTIDFQHAKERLRRIESNNVEVTSCLEEPKLHNIPHAMR